MDCLIAHLNHVHTLAHTGTFGKDFEKKQTKIFFA